MRLSNSSLAVKLMFCAILFTGCESTFTSNKMINDSPSSLNSSGGSSSIAAPTTATPTANPKPSSIPTAIASITPSPSPHSSPVSFGYTGSPLSTSFIPPNPTTPVSGDLFAMTIVNLAAPPALTGLTPFPNYPVSALRLWDVAEWAGMEWKQGSIDWSKMDNTITIARKNGVQDFIQTFGHLPAWAALNPNIVCPLGESTASCSPPIMSYFDEWVKATVQRYCGSVKYYEPWNEPNSPSFWGGTNAQLLEVAQHVYQIAKDPANCGCTNGICKPGGGVNPNKVLLPPITGIYAEPWSTELDWLETFLASAGPVYPYADIATFHGYVQQTPELLASQLPAYKAVLAKHGLENLPIWNTEGSFEEDYKLSSELSASFVMTYYITQAAAGISRVFWYAYDNCGWGTLYSSPLCTTYYKTTLPGPSGQLLPAGEAYGTMESWLAGAALNFCSRYNNGLWICGLQRSGGYQSWVMWSGSTTPITVAVPQGIGLKDYRDWQNNLTAVPPQLTITQMPVMLETVTH